MNKPFESEPSMPEFNRRRFLKTLLASAALLTLVGCAAKTAEFFESTKKAGEFSTAPSWEQDFTAMQNGPVDTKVWRYELDAAVPTYNNEEQAFTNSEQNVRIEDGKLVLEAHREPYAYPSGEKYNFTSGRIDTLGNFDFEYGKFEITMKLPKGSGTWPAFWFLSANQPFTEKLQPSDEEWAQPRTYMHDGELDGVEAYGNRPGIIEATLHAFNKDTEFTTTINDSADTFHTYTVEVAPTKVEWLIDGKVYGSIAKPSDNSDDWPFGKGNRFYPILNLAMGSDGGKIEPGVDSWRMEVSKLAYFEYVEN